MVTPSRGVRTPSHPSRVSGGSFRHMRRTAPLPSWEMSGGGNTGSGPVERYSHLPDHGLSVSSVLSRFPPLTREGGRLMGQFSRRSKRDRGREVIYARLSMVRRKTGAADARSHFLRHLGDVSRHAYVTDRSGGAGSGAPVVAGQSFP